MKIELDKIFKFIMRQKVVFKASVDSDGFPNQQAMLPPRKIEANLFFNQYFIYA